MFLCDMATESECLAKRMVGTTQINALWAMRVRPGDDIYLFNFQTGRIRGPFSATSSADCYDADAWGGNFPVQIRISKTTFTKQADNGVPGAPALLRKRRPYGDIKEASKLLFSWLQEVGTDMV
jgi:hypothetical protein